jgi:hypothetical protein
LRSSPLAQAFVFVTHERREKITDDAPRPRLDLDRHRHSWREIDGLVLDLHPSAVKRHAGGVDQLLALRLAAARFRALITAAAATIFALSNQFAASTEWSRPAAT